MIILAEAGKDDRRLREHYEVSEGKDFAIFKCRYCGREFSGRDRLLTVAGHPFSDHGKRDFDADIDDPELSNERDFQRAAIFELQAQKWINGEMPHVIEPFGLDAAVFITTEEVVGLKLLEFKAFAGHRPGGVGFGDRRGEGPQVDLLCLPEEALRKLSALIRWCFADLTKLRGDRRYAILDSSGAKRAAMGHVGPGQQNNFNVGRCMISPLTWREFVTELVAFVRAVSVLQSHHP